MKYLFEENDYVYNTYSLKKGQITSVCGVHNPYLVVYDDGEVVWESGEWLLKYTKALDEAVVNDAGEDVSCTIDDTLEQRGKRYGTFEKHSELSQRLSKSISTHAYLNGVSLSDVHTEALNQICHKIARIANGDPNYDDSWRDIAGYATLVVKHLNGEDV